MRAARNAATDGAEGRRRRGRRATLTRGPGQAATRGGEEERGLEWAAAAAAGFLGPAQEKGKGLGGLKEGERSVGRQDSARDGILEKEKIYSFLCFSWIQTKVQIQTKFI